MNRALLSKRISSLLAEISRLSNALCAMNTMDLQRYPENYELLSTDAALRAEQIACRMRHLVYGFTTVQKHEYLTSAANVLGITITAQPGLVEITLPGLLPKKKQRSAEYLTDPLEQALGQFTKEHLCSRFDSCVICFCHIYAVSGGRGRIRDYDNLEMKQILDVVCAYLGGTDQYANLILILEPVHKLIHAKKPETIQRYMAMLELDAPQLAKVNALRKMLKNAEIHINQQ